MHVLFIFITISRDKMLPKKYFNNWNRIEKKIIFVYSIPPILTRYSMEQEKLHYFKYYNSDEIVKCLMVDHLVKFNKVHLNFDLVSGMVKEIFSDMC